MEKNNVNNDLEQMMGSYARRAAEDRLRAELAANYTRMRRRWMLHVGAVLTMVLVAVVIGSAAAMPAPSYAYMHGVNASTPNVTLSDINATLEAL